MQLNIEYIVYLLVTYCEHIHLCRCCSFT